MEEPEYDKVTQASLNGIYVKAQEMDRGHNDEPAPSFMPPGSRGDVESHASTHASDGGEQGDSPFVHLLSDSFACGPASAQRDCPPVHSDTESHASTHASDGE